MTTMTITTDTGYKVRVEGTAGAYAYGRNGKLKGVVVETATGRVIQDGLRGREPARIASRLSVENPEPEPLDT